MKPTRRDFLKSSAAGVTISFLAPSFATQLLAAEAGGGDRILVILQMAGGNDAVNTFVPYTDARYRSLRPTLALADSSILKVDNRLGFHPSMAKLAPLYEAGKFTFVNSVGFPTLDRSHFRCQDVWQTADDSYGQTQRGIRGWVGRYADLYLGDSTSSLTSLSIGNRIPLGMVANDTISAVVQDATTFDVQTDERYPSDRPPLLSAMRDLYAGETGSSDVAAIRKSGAEMFSSIDLLKTITPASTTAAYPATPLGRGMSLIAQTIASAVGTRVVWITTGGFDTHSTQADDHIRLLTDVSDSLAAFQQDVDERGMSDRVLVMAWSEFGRRVSENASAGTDHGKAGTVFVMGSSVNGRTFYGDVPDLGNLDAGDLRTEIDFRSIYATIIRDYLGHDPEPVLNGRYDNLGFIRASSPVGRRRPVKRG
jgi:uncharacterized protein (DUF1501 family)